MQLKSSFISNSTRHLYDFAEEIAIDKTAVEKTNPSVKLATETSAKKE
jgi:hypothetical protein